MPETSYCLCELDQHLFQGSCWDSEEEDVKNWGQEG